jgi:hypothetical protein
VALTIEMIHDPRVIRLGASAGMEPDVLKYDLRFDDLGTWTKPWSFTILLGRADHPVYEYACYEGNYGLPAILRGARAQEAAGRP